MYETIGKVLVYFWGIVLVVFALKFIGSNFNSIIDVSKNTANKVTVVIKKNIAEYNTMKLPLKEKYGMYIEEVTSCEDELKSTYKNRLLDSSISRAGNSCSDGKCKLFVEFKNEIPETVELAVKENSDGYCLLKRYTVGEDYQVLGYFVELEITEDLKQKLDIEKSEYEIRLKNAIAYHSSTVSGSEKILFDYEKKLESDTILVDGEEKVIVKFY